MHSILVIGGTGAQGAAVVRYLSSTGQYAIRIQTRNVDSTQAKELGTLSNVTLVTGGYDDASLTAALEGMEYVFVNTDGFAVGQQAETYWGMRIFELARRVGVKHLVYSGLDYLGPKTDFDPKFEVGHYLGKAHVAEYMKAQPTSPMNWSVISSGPYMESLFDNMKPHANEDGTQFTFALPLGDGEIPFIVLNDFARYVDWLFAHPEQSSGLNLHVATVHASGADIATAFIATNPGKTAVFASIPISAWHDVAWAKLPSKKETKIGYRSVSDGRALLQTYEQNFSNWWNLYKYSVGNKGVITRDYEMLDRILPDRVKSVEEWMTLEGYNGEAKSILQPQA
jgi:nucleoside-diphosphate-sugar epimerase